MVWSTVCAIKVLWRRPKTAQHEQQVVAARGSERRKHEHKPNRPYDVFQMSQDGRATVASHTLKTFFSSEIFLSVENFVDELDKIPELRERQQ